LLALLATGLFTGGCHELEEVFGETPVVYRIEGDFWNHKKFPMVLFKPFGYSDHPTILMVSCFWGFGLLLVLAHYIKSQKSSSAGSSTTTKEKDLEAGVPLKELDNKQPSGANAEGVTTSAI